jgi:hypothetical protein
VEENIMDNHVGRILTVDRVRELNAKDWFYQILKDSPRIHEIYPGIEDSIIEGSIDHHIHVYPDFVQRNQDMIQVATEAARAGMRSVCFKDHYNLTANCAYLVQKQVDAMVERGELSRGVEVYGGIGLNFGMNPEAVRIALQYPNCKMVWFPTFNSAGYYRTAGKEPPLKAARESASGTRTTSSFSLSPRQRRKWEPGRSWTTRYSNSISLPWTRSKSSRTLGPM